MTVYRVPVDGHGAVLVEADDEEEAFDVAQETRFSTDAANLSLEIDDSYRERVEAVENPRRDPINVQRTLGDTSSSTSVPSFGSVDDLRTARNALGLSQREVADRLDVSPKTVSHYENGTREISLSRAREYANVLHRAALGEVEA